MPTDKPRFSIVLEPEMSEELDTYWHDNRFKSKNAAINDLLRNAFALIERESAKSDSLGISPAALDVARQYDRLSESSQKLISMIVLFESADLDVRNRLVALLVDHNNERIQRESSLEQASSELLAALTAPEDE